MYILPQCAKYTIYLIGDICFNWVDATASQLHASGTNQTIHLIAINTFKKKLFRIMYSGLTQIYGHSVRSPVWLVKMLNMQDICQMYAIYLVLGYNLMCLKT